MSEITGQPFPRRNPFSPMAVAEITNFEESGGDDLTIQTDAFRQAIAYLSDYLDSAAVGDGMEPDGKVIAILGDYGTGKTHLAVRLVRHARRFLDQPEQAMYLDATGDGFVELHRRFMRKLGLTGVREQVSNYYADVVAEALQKSGLESADFVAWQRDRELTPRVMAELGESALLPQVQQRLERVTRKPDFGTALPLLLRSGFEEIVWAWLTGGKPDKVLQEQGITRPIDNEVTALEAMGAVALLYGGRRAQFVLVIDELEKIFSGASQPAEDTVMAFETLLEVFGNAGACLVLSGLPEFRRVLPHSALERVSHTVELTSLSVDEVCSFIKLAQKVKLGRDELKPFDLDSVRYLTSITRGNARQVIKLCHDVYHVVDRRIRATGEDTLVTNQMVADVARQQFGSLSASGLDGVVRRVLDANGWSYLSNHRLGDSKDSRVDFLVTFHDRAGGCAVLLTEAVLNGADADAVVRRVSAVRDAAPDNKVVLVVNKVLADAFAAAVAEPLDAEPLVYMNRGFSKDFKALIGAIRDQLHRAGDSAPLAEMQGRMEQLNRQQASIYDSIMQLGEHIDESRVSSDRRLAAIERLTDRVVAAPAGLPSEVDKLFTDAVGVLDELTPEQTMMSEAFSQLSPDTSQAVQRRLSSDSFFDAIGVAKLTRDAVLLFRAAVTDWYARQVTGSSGVPPAVADERLDLICRAYDDMTEFLPMFKLEVLARLAPRTARVGEVRAALDNLSPRVRGALSAFPAGRAETKWSAP